MGSSPPPKPEIATVSSKSLGSEQIVSGSNGESVATLLDFWRWSSSNLLENRTRGIFAEFIVACSLGIQSKERVEWAAYDLLSDAGIRIEVKSASYVQAWKQKRPSTITFDIRPTTLWDESTGTYSDKRERRSDLYVFCLLGNPQSRKADPFDLSQWTFYLLPTMQLETKVPNQKTISLSGLENLGASKCTYLQLCSEIKTLAKLHRKTEEIHRSSNT